jgi:hypothetical protein
MGLSSSVVSQLSNGIEIAIDVVMPIAEDLAEPTVFGGWWWQCHEFRKFLRSKEREHHSVGFAWDAMNTLRAFASHNLPQLVIHYSGFIGG